MSYASPPTSVRSLEQRIRNLEGSEELALRRRIGMALVVVGQMLPEGAIKGGSAMALRYGRGTRFTQDLDAARVRPLAGFRSDFEESLASGWAGFSGRLIEKAAPRPPAVPTAYVMQPFEVKLDYRGRSWCTVKFELGHNEIGDADGPEYKLAADLAALFTEVGLEPPIPCRSCVPIIRSHRSSTLSRRWEANGHAISLTSNSSKRLRNSTMRRWLRPASGSSTTGGSRRGHLPSRPASAGTRSMPKPLKVSTSSKVLNRQPPGATSSSRASRHR